MDTKEGIQVIQLDFVIFKFYMADRSMHCVMPNIQAAEAETRQELLRQTGCEQPRGRDRRLSGLWGTERPGDATLLVL